MIVGLMLIRLRYTIAILLFGISAFAASLLYVWARHQSLHLFLDIDQSHQHVFGFVVGLRTFLAVVFVLVLRSVARIKTLVAWLFCGFGAAATIFPVITIGVILTGRNIPLMSLNGPLDVQYELLAASYAANLLVGMIYGAVGWLFMQRLMHD